MLDDLALSVARDAVSCLECTEHKGTRLIVVRPLQIFQRVAARDIRRTRLMLLSPLEVASAFGAPIFAKGNSNMPATAMYDALGDKKFGMARWRPDTE